MDSAKNRVHTLLFVTTNTGKFQEVQRWLAKWAPDIQLEQAALDIPECQSLDVYEVARGKALHAWQCLQKPLLIDDGGIYLERYNNFPGTLSKYVYQGIGFEGIWRLAHDDPRAYFLSCIVYTRGPDNYQVFDGICNGMLINPTGVQITHKQLPFTDIFVPNGATQVFSMLKNTVQEEEFNHRAIALKKFVVWFKKFNGQALQ
jgi:XTP/dITP diphosphohydrolase